MAINRSNNCLLALTLLVITSLTAPNHVTGHTEASETTAATSTALASGSSSDSVWVEYGYAKCSAELQELQGVDTLYCARQCELRRTEHGLITWQMNMSHGDNVVGRLRGTVTLPAYNLSDLYDDNVNTFTTVPAGSNLSITSDELFAVRSVTFQLPEIVANNTAHGTKVLFFQGIDLSSLSNEGTLQTACGLDSGEWTNNSVTFVCTKSVVGTTFVLSNFSANVTVAEVDVQGNTLQGCSKSSSGQVCFMKCDGNERQCPSYHGDHNLSASLDPLYASSTPSVNITWEPMKLANTTVLYDVYLTSYPSDKNGMVNVVENLTVSDTTHLLVNFTADTTYVVQVRMKTCFSSGNFSNALNVTLCDAIGRPNAPQNFAVVPLNSSCLNLTWNAPAPNGQSEYLYKLHCDATCSDCQSQSSSNHSDLHTVVCGLINSTDYTCVLAAHTSCGESDKARGSGMTLAPEEEPTEMATTIEPDEDGRLSGDMLVIIVAAVGGALLTCLIVTAVVLLRRRQRGRRIPRMKTAYAECVPLTSLDPTDNYPRTDEVEYMNTNDSSHRIPLADLEAYVAANVELIKQEYKSLPGDNLYSSTVAMKAENKSRNRFQNIHPYDHTRVVLKQDDENANGYADDDGCLDAGGDNDLASSGDGYINASYIYGYSRKKQYIATQGPLSKTVADFWRMVWTENCAVIVMLTSFVEEGKRKCEEYFANDDEMHVYGGVGVQRLSIKTLADYQIRSFKLTKKGHTKIVHHFHYLSWPDHGVPSCYAPFLLFRRKVLLFADCIRGPTVVHCSAGIGRTGAYIAVDSLLEEAAGMGSVDIRAAVVRLRTQRPNMVQNQDQYLFIHGAVLRGALTYDFILLPSELADHCKLLRSSERGKGGKTALQYEFELVCASFAEKPSEDEYTGSLAPENAAKNRDKTVLALESLRPFLTLLGTKSSDYINAVVCNSYHLKNGFIATQMPLSQTIDDFWRLAYDYNCATIIMLENDMEGTVSCPQYWPNSGKTICTGSFTVTSIFEETDTKTLYTVRDFEMQPDDTKKGPRLVRQYELLFWPADARDVPSSTEEMLGFAEVFSEWQRQSGERSAIVQCMNGASRSGLFISAMNALDRVKEEQEIDVFHAVEMAKISRPQFVNQQAQYHFLYLLISDFLSTFDTYANFRS